MNQSRNRILETLKKNTPDKRSPLPETKDFSFLYADTILDKVVYFAEELVKTKGKLVYCDNQEDLQKKLALLFKQNNWDSIFCLDEDIQAILMDSEIPFASANDDMITIQAGITKCEFLVARFGSVVLSSRQLSGRRLGAFSPVHIVLAYTSQVVSELDDALGGLHEKYNGMPSMVTFITGPSRTADIEKTLVMGAHGPKDLIVFLVNKTE